MTVFSVVLYSSTEPPGELPHCVPDANTYHPFKTMNTAITERITAELRALTDVDEDGVSFMSSLSPVHSLR